MDWFPYDSDLRHDRVNKATKMTGNKIGNNGLVDSGNLCTSFALTSNVQHNKQKHFRCVFRNLSEP